VTRPLEALVRFTNEVAGGDTSRRAQEDSTEVGTLAAAFNAMLQRLEQSLGAQVRSEKLALAGLFAARVAHDIRNPLASIKMQTDVLRARLRGADPATVTALDAVQRDVLQVNSVVRDLLELSRPGTLAAHPVSLNGIVTETLDQVAPQLTYRHVSVDLRLNAGDITVNLDAARFKQALLNIINNASDAMPTGGTLTIATALDRDNVRIDVCDDGEGVDPSVVARVFDPFVSTKRDGMGLGLVNAKAVVESHGGTIALAAEVPRGTRVTLRIPRGDTDHG
jgi:signal transduction histidine kinase